MKYIKLVSFLSIGLFSVLFLGSCGDNPKELLTKSIKSALKDNQGISVVEFTEIKALIQNNSELSQTFNTDEAIKAFILATADEMCKSSRSKINCPVTIECCSNAVSTTNNKLIFDFFYENSASMDGYISSKSNFSEAVLGMIAKASIKENTTVNTYYVNNGVFPFNDKMAKMENFLKPENTKKYGQRGNSEINKILSIAVDSALTKPERVTVLISDYIYSMKGKKVAEELDVLKNTTTIVINKLAKKDYATVIVKLNSKFTGTFYTSMNTPVTMSEDRPVYLWIFCHKSMVSKIVNDFELDQLKGYDKHIVLMNDTENPVYYTGLIHTNKQGRCEKQDRSSREIKNIESIKLNRDGKFSLGIAVDLSSLALMDTDKLNPNNYEVISTTNNTFSIDKVDNIKVLENNDRELAGTATHIITLSLNEKPKSGKQKLTINFKKQVPSWVKEVSTEDDSNSAGRINKTFGLEALINGAALGYYYNDKSKFISLTLNIKN
jgi:hypothetical protein